MKLSDSGRVVVVDDKHSEARPLLEALGRHSVPYLYYDGSAANLPSSRPGGVRFVFLDIVLAGMQGQDDKTKASGLVAILQKIIDKENGPYVIVFWTQHSEVIDRVIENCVTRGIAPIAHVDIEKAACLTKPDPVKAISTTLNQKLKEIGAFQLYVEWENLINVSSKRYIGGLSSIIPLNKKWSDATESLFYCLYESFVEKADLKDKSERFKCACHILNRSYLDTLEKLTDSELKLPSGFTMANKETVSDELKARISASIFLAPSHPRKASSGNVFRMMNKELEETLRRGLFKDGQAPSKSFLFGVVITPLCDIAHDKLLPGLGNGHCLHRMLYGLCVEHSGPVSKLKGSLRKGNGAVEHIGPIWHDNKSVVLMVDPRTMSYLAENRLRSKPLYCLQADKLFDLQSKAANHTNRLGSVSIE